MLDLERQQYKADLDNQVAENRITKGKDGIAQAQADHLLALYDQADADKRQKLLDDEQEQRQRDVAMLEEHDFDRKREALEKLDDLATTQSDRRQIELDILNLAYQEKEQALQRIIDNSKDQAAIEDARRDLVALKASYSADKQGVMNRTQSPLGAYFASVPQSAKEIGETLENFAVKGLEDFNNQLADAIVNAKSLKEVFHSVAGAILQDLIKLALQQAEMALFKAVIGGTQGFANGGSITVGSLPGFATGGGITVGGRSGTDKNLLSLNGMPIARVSMGERINIANDDARPMSVMPPVALTMHNDFRGADPSAVAAINARLNQFEQEFPSKVVGAVQDAKSRFVIR
jgi:hypothetical protein